MGLLSSQEQPPNSTEHDWRGKTDQSIHENMRASCQGTHRTVRADPHYGELEDRERLFQSLKSSSNFPRVVYTILLIFL